MDSQCSVSPTVKENCNLFGHHHQKVVLAPNWIPWVLKRLFSSLGHSSWFFITVKSTGWYGSHPASKFLSPIFQVMLLPFQFHQLTPATSVCPLKLISVMCLTFWITCSLITVWFLSQNLFNNGLTGKILNGPSNFLTIHKHLIL